MSHSALAIAYVGIAGALPSVAFAVIGGTLADRYDRRRLMISADLVRSIAWGSLSAYTFLVGFQLVPVLAVVAVNSTFLMLFNPAAQAYLPRLVATDELASANGTIQSTWAVVGFVAFGLGGTMVVLLGAAPCLGCNGLTFLGSAVCILSIRPRAVPAAERAPSGFLTDLRGGFAYLRSQVGLLSITISALFVNFAISLPYVFLVVYTVVVLHGGATLYGILLAAISAGTALGAPMVHRYRRVALPNAGKIWQIHVILFGPALLAFVLVPSPVAALGAGFAAGFLIGFGGTTWLSAAQTVVPPEMQGRYFGVDALGSFAILPLASLVGGLVTQSYGIAVTFWLGGLGALATGLAFLPVRALWRFGVPRSEPVR